jgi:hypothetical protein
MQNRVFFPQAALDQWIVDGTVDLQRGELTILAEGRRFALEEAVHVLREVTGAGDAAKLVGRVRTRAALEGLGAELVETSMLLGETAYDVEPGWVGTPIGSFADHLESGARRKARSAGTGGGGSGTAPAAGPAPHTDEELLAKFLAKNL